MSKLPKEYQFIDLSDYGRPAAKIIVKSIKHTKLTPVHVTIGFVIAGLIAILCLLNGNYLAAAFFLILKSTLDAADGELARVKNTPSHTGRYLDSVSDIILNFLIFIAIWYVTSGSLIYTLIAFFGIQLQGTLYNFYYVILRNKCNGDTTSRVYENGTPTAMKGENQRNVNVLFSIYTFCYGLFDKIIYWLDGAAAKSKRLPKWLMTAVSTFGLGFQLLIIGLMLNLQLENYIIPFFIVYSGFILVFVGVRRYLNKELVPQSVLK